MPGKGLRVTRCEFLRKHVCLIIVRIPDLEFTNDDLRSKKLEARMTIDQ